MNSLQAGETSWRVSLLPLSSLPTSQEKYGPEVLDGSGVATPGG